MIVFCGFAVGIGVEVFSTTTGVEVGRVVAVAEGVEVASGISVAVGARVWVIVGAAVAGLVAVEVDWLVVLQPTSTALSVMSSPNLRPDSILSPLPFWI